MPISESIHEVPQVFIDMPSISGFEDLDINGNVTLEIKGKIKSLSQNEDNQSMRVEVSEVEIISKERNDNGLGKLKKSMNKSLNRLPSENQPIPSPSG